MSAIYGHSRLPAICLEKISSGTGVEAITPVASAPALGTPISTGRYVPQASRNAGSMRDPIAGWLGPQTYSPNAATQERKLAQRRAADLAANDWAAGSALSAITQNAIGIGLVPKVAIPASELGITDEQAQALGKRMEWIFSRWTQYADATGQMHFHDLQILGLRSILSQGEMLHWQSKIPPVLFRWQSRRYDRSACKLLAIS